ncbi:restriction endonuclease [Rufibacter latericius]|nr:restriction endonuclease [Rufibacter latericius]
MAELSYPLQDKGYLTIGFSDLTSNDIIDQVLKNYWNSFNSKFKEVWNTVPRTRHNLWNFLKFNKGDIVIVPSWGTFYVCEIIDEKPFIIGETYSDGLTTWDKKKVFTNSNLLLKEDGSCYDLGFARKVNVLYKNIPRDKFADSKLTSRMKIRQTNAQIDDLKNSIENSIDNYKKNKPIHLHSIIVEKTAGLVLESIKSELNPDKFEKLVKTYFKTIGANEVTIPAKNESNKEGDADIVAVFENIKLIIYIQAKFQTGQINEWGTTQVLDYKTNKESIADGYNKIAWVITTASKFDSRAENLAKENQIQLVNGMEFSKMLLNAGINLLNKNL